MKNTIKKSFIIIIGLIIIVLFRIDFKKNTPKEIETKAFNCTSTNETDEYKIESIYNVQYKENIITAILSSETITSDNEDFIETYYKETKEKYDELNNLYGGHIYSIGKASSSISLKTTIDYTKVNMINLLKNDSTLKQYSNDKNQLTVTGIKEYYSSLGITCE